MGGREGLQESTGQGARGEGPASLEGWTGYRGGRDLTLQAGHWLGGRGSRACRGPPPVPVPSSPSGAVRLKTITREMGPSCRTVHVCKTSAQRARTQGSAPVPGPGPRPGPHLDSAGRRGRPGRDHSDSRELRGAGMCQGGCGHPARGRWWAGGQTDRWTAQRTISGSQHPPLPVAAGSNLICM